MKKKRFGELFSDSWKEYKDKFGLFFKIFLLLYIIPALILYVLGFLFNLRGGNIAPGDVGSLFSSPYFIAIMIVGLISFLLYILMIAVFVYVSLNKKTDLRKSLKKGKKYFWRFLGYGLVVGIIMWVLLFMGVLSIIQYPGVIGSVLLIISLVLWVFLVILWVFSPYILIKENKGIINSLRGSFRYTKNKRLRILGYFVLFLLIVIGISLLVSLVSFVVNWVISLPFGSISEILSGTALPNYMLFITGFIDEVFNWVVNLIIIPLSILFFKNFYLDVR